MDDDSDHSFIDVVQGTPSPDAKKKVKLKKSASNLARNHSTYRASSSTSSPGSAGDLSIYPMEAGSNGSPGKIFSYSYQDNTAGNSQHLPLPSDSNFATERARAIRQKKLKDKISPFKFPKHASSDFVKSSALLTSGDYKQGRTNMFSSGDHTEKSANTFPKTLNTQNNVLERKAGLGIHKRKNGSVIDTQGGSKSPIFNGTKRIKKATVIGWPSSSESSDDDEERNDFNTKNKRFKRSFDSPRRSAQNISNIQSDLSNNQHVMDNSWTCQLGEKRLEQEKRTAHLINHGLQERIRMKSKFKSPKANRFSDPSTNSSVTLPLTHSISPIKVNPSLPVINSVSPLKMTSRSPDFKHKLPHKMNNNSTVCNRESSSCTNLSFCTPKVSNRVFPRSHTERNNRRDEEELNDPAYLEGYNVGRTVVPQVIDLTATTPDSARVLKQVEQMEEDEAMARSLQEELDKEFAMALAQQQDSVTVAEPTSTMGEGSSGYCTPPYAQREPYVSPAASRYGEADSTEILQMLADMDPEREPPRRSAGSRRRTRATGVRRNDGDFSQQILQMLQEIQPQLDVERWNMISPGHMRRGRRGIVTPNRAGNDYEELLRLGEMMGDARDKGLSKGDMNRLPIISYRKTENGDAEAECNICMCNYEEGDSQKMLPCFHSYHAKCIDQWIAKNATCPVCRVDIKL